MYVSVRKYHTTPGAINEIAKRVNEGFLPIISQAPGFIAYYAIETGEEDVVASVSVFEDEAGADESNRMAAEWVKANIAALFAGPPETTAGNVLAHGVA